MDSKNMSFLLTAIASLSLALGGSACTNSRLKGAASQLTTNNSNTGASGPTGSSSSLDVFKISSVTIPPPQNGGAAGAAVPTVSIFFDTSKAPLDSSGSPVPISNHCNLTNGGAQTSKPCSCQFTWSEINSTSGSNTSIPRIVVQPVTIVQSNLITCSAPDVYNSEISDGTTIQITVVPTNGNPDGGSFSVSPFPFTKNTSSVAGSFQDSQGHVFDNVLHYSCYEQYKRGMEIKSLAKQENNATTGGSKWTNYANQFCVATLAGGANNQQGCQDLSAPDFTAQAYYYNLYIRDSEHGDINLFNDRYVCPVVTESLVGSQTLGGQGQPWPLDATFALSLGKTADFSVGVTSFTKLSNGSDPTAADDACSAPADGQQQAQANASSFVRSCLGFAAKPNSDGTCPYFRDSSGAIRLTYRLRRYIALYPPIFDTSGFPLQQPQATDTIYVLDRPVSVAGGDPLHPYTMLGPKPCPFAFFDAKGVTGVALGGGGYPNNVLPGYHATNDALWSGKNVDGTQFPNIDILPKQDGTGGSCAAMIPLTYYTNTADPNSAIITLGTIYSNSSTGKANNQTYKSDINGSFSFKLDHLYVRPIQPWAPHYVEDTSFQACAPQASPVRDPPLHFARDSASGNVGWCEEAYPSQNPNVSVVDYRPDTNSAYLGQVVNFTSHVAKGSASASCRATVPVSVIPATYPGTGPAWHQNTLPVDKDSSSTVLFADKTCDRTVANAGLTWGKFPMLAAPGDVESAIKSDSAYFCSLTFDGNGVKTNPPTATSVVTPTQGCCGLNVKVWSGSPSAPNNASIAHLEPDAICQTPQY